MTDEDYIMKKLAEIMDELPPDQRARVEERARVLIEEIERLREALEEVDGALVDGATRMLIGQIVRNALGTKETVLGSETGVTPEGGTYTIDSKTGHL
jgi:uncharacterized protein (DUF2236 family)